MAQQPEGLRRGRHIGRLHVILHIIGQNTRRVLRVDLILGGAGNDDVRRHLPGLFPGVKLHAETLRVGRHRVFSAAAHGKHIVEFFLGADAVRVMDIAVGAGQGDDLRPQLGSLAADAPAHVAEAGNGDPLALQRLLPVLQHP